MGEWQPIASAPKDGTSILCWAPMRKEALVLKWDASFNLWRTTAYAFIGFAPRDIQHWMPLPAGPFGDIPHHGEIA